MTHTFAQTLSLMSSASVVAIAQSDKRRAWQRTDARLELARRIRTGDVADLDFAACVELGLVEE